MKKKLYLSSWINFGKYRREPSILKKILDTEEGLSLIHISEPTRPY